MNKFIQKRSSKMGHFLGLNHILNDELFHFNGEKIAECCIIEKLIENDRFIVFGEFENMESHHEYDKTPCVSWFFDKKNKTVRQSDLYSFEIVESDNRIACGNDARVHEYLKNS